jgi:hypothetical protein
VDGTTVRIQNSTRAHANSLGLLLANYDPKVLQDEGAWLVEVQLGELAGLLVKLFDTIGAWLDTEQVDSLLLHFDERRYTLLRPSKERTPDSDALLLERVAQLETALETRIAIKQAKGVLARALGLSTDEAFDVLRKASRDRGAKLRDLAATIAASPDQAEAMLAGAIDTQD